jgi:hypothetical protein
VYVEELASQIRQKIEDTVDCYGFAPVSLELISRAFRAPEHQQNWARKHGLQYGPADPELAAQDGTVVFRPADPPPVADAVTDSPDGGIFADQEVSGRRPPWPDSANARWTEPHSTDGPPELKPNGVIIH